MQAGRDLEQSGLMGGVTTWSDESSRVNSALVLNHDAVTRASCDSYMFIHNPGGVWAGSKLLEVAPVKLVFGDVSPGVIGRYILDIVAPKGHLQKKP